MKKHPTLPYLDFLRKNAVSCLHILLFSFPLFTQAQDRPSLGIALSGGGAKGLAHIGVLQEFEKAGIYPDVVSGTSMGSIVGGLYAIGYDPYQLEEVTLSIDWNDYFSDSYRSAFIPIEERRRSGLYQITFPVIDGKVGLPQGLLQGRKIQTLLGLLTIPAHASPSFDNFFRPFRAVATDIETGKAYVFNQGQLHHAIRASMAIPSVFSPVNSLDDRLLVDGLVVRNLPVKEVIDMGADVSLAVDVGGPLYTRDELYSLFTIVEQTASFGSAAFNDEQRELSDIILDPDLRDYTTLSYDATDSIIAYGAATARRELPRIKRQLDSLGISLPMPQPERAQLQLDSFLVTAIDYECEDPHVNRILQKLTRVKLPRVFSRHDINRQIAKLYGSGFFDAVDFQLIPLADGHQLRLQATAAADWRVRLSAAYDSDYEIALLLNLTGRNIIGRGSVLAMDLRISEFPRATLEYLLYNQTRPSIGLRLLANANFYPGRVYESTQLRSDFRAHHYSSRLSAFSGFWGNRYLEAGILSEHLSQNSRFISFEGNETVIDRQALFVEFIRETYDRAVYPKRGSYYRFFLQSNLSGTERTGNNDRLSLGSNLLATAMQKVIIPTSKKMVIDWEIAGGFVNRRRSNFLNQLFLGRPLPDEPLFFNAYGQRHMELPVSGFFTSTLGLRWEVGLDNFISLHYQYGLYAQTDGNLLQTGGDDILNPDRTNGIFQGFALGLGSRTLLGPVRLNTEYNPELGRLNFNFHLGYYF
ncbi:MAG: patatin-like phospholipase family protein [Bacteroidota bacterium]